MDKDQKAELGLIQWHQITVGSLALRDYLRCPLSDDSKQTKFPKRDCVSESSNWIYVLDLFHDEKHLVDLLMAVK